MRKGFVILFVLVFFLRGFDLVIEGPVLLPSLVAHFHTHLDHLKHHHDEELSFIEFFWQHYGGQKHHDDDGENHANLPFSHSCKCCGDFATTLLKNIFMQGLFLAEDAKSKGYLAFNSLYSHLYTRDIFRPPLS